MLQNVQSRNGVIQSRAELLWSGRTLTTKVGNNLLQLVGLRCDVWSQSDSLEFNPTQSDVHRTEGRKLFSRKNNMLTNHDSNRNRNMSRTDEGEESETNEDKQKNEVRDAFTTQPWSQLVHCASIYCHVCGRIFQEDWIVARSSGEEWYIDW